VKRVPILLLFTCASSLYAQSRFHVTPTPSNFTVHDAATDRHGFPWLATTAGLFRFDGSHYLHIPVLGWKDLRHIAIGPDQSIWVAGDQGLASYQSNRWTIRHTRPVRAFQAAKDGLWIVTTSLEYTRWNGAIERHEWIQPNGELTVDRTSKRDAVWFPRGNTACRFDGTELSCRQAPPGNWQRALAAPDGTLWFSSALAIAASTGEHWDSPHNLQSGRSVLDPLLSPAGKLWMLRTANGDPRFNNWLTMPLTDLCEAWRSETSRWICTENYFGHATLEPTWRVWRSVDLLSPVGFLPGQHPNIPIVHTQRGLFELDLPEETWRQPWKSVNLDIRDVISDSQGGFYMATVDRGLVAVDPRGNLRPLSTPCANIDTYRVLFQDSKARRWVGGKDANCLLQMLGTVGSERFVRPTLPVIPLQTVSMAEHPNGDVWVGWQEGFLRLDNTGNWSKVPTSEPVQAVRNFAFENPNVVWVSHRVPGHFTRLERHRKRDGEVWQARRYPPTTHPPNETHFFRVDRRGWIWRGTNDGVFIARPGHTEAGEWLRLDARRGLIIGGVGIQGFYDSPNGDVWLSGAKGAMRIHPRPDWFDAPRSSAPKIAAIFSHTQTWRGPDNLPMHIPADAPLRIEFSSLDAPPFQDNPLWFRYHDREPWQRLKGEQLEWSRPPSGKLSLQVRYAGDGDPPVLHVNLNVGDSAVSWVWWLLAIAALPAAVWTIRNHPLLAYWFRKHLFLARRKQEALLGEERVGDVIAGRYRLHQLLAKSSMSSTYLARDTKTPEAPTLVVKILHRARDASSEARQRFAQEVAALRTIHHPGVVPLLESMILPDGAPALVMPLVPGVTLRQRLEAGPLGREATASLARQLASALAEIHRHGFVHRDVKPENILVHEGHAVLIDLGASALRGPEDELEETTTITGSLAYLAPERLLFRYHEASDTYALGVVLLECLTGKQPSEFDAAPLEKEFIDLVQPWMNAHSANLLVETLRHQPTKRPQDIEIWAARFAESLCNPDHRP
jgi:hypothetical protein